MSPLSHTQSHHIRPVAKLLMLASLVLCSPSLARSQDPALALESTLTKVIAQAEPSVVSIARIRPQHDPRVSPNNNALGQPVPDSGPLDPENPEFQPNLYGAGILIAGARPQDRVVLTNYHVVQGGPIYLERQAEDQTTLFIRFGDRRSCFASIIAADPRSDLAILHLDLQNAKIDAGDLKPLDWSASVQCHKGQLVVMLGNPYAIAHDGSASASWGMVSNLARRPLPWTDDPMAQSMMYRLGNLIQIDGRLNLGTSGGPLLNLKGELIGLTTSLAAIEGYEKSAGFAIPIDDLTRRIVKDLVAGHEVEYGMLGIVPVTFKPDLNTGIKQAIAVRVDRVNIYSPAQQAGINVGDIILSVDETPIYSAFDLMRVVGLHAPEEQVKIGIWRNGRGRSVVTVTLGKWPVFNDEGIIETVPRHAPWRGISVDYSTGRKKYHDVSDPHRPAVVVTKVAAGSAAETAEVLAGTFISEVNRIPVQTPGQFAEAVKSLRGPVELRLYDRGRVMILDEVTPADRGSAK